MAEEATEPEDGGAGGGNKKLLIIIIVVLLVVGGGVGAFFGLSGSKGGEDAGDDGEDDGEYLEEEELETGLPPAVLPLETFIVNLQVKGSFLKTTIQLEFAEPELPATIETDIPKVRDTIIRILSSKSSADILTTAGKDGLREEIRDGVNETLGADDVTEIYFTEFIIQ